MQTLQKQPSLRAVAFGVSSLTLKNSTALLVRSRVIPAVQAVEVEYDPNKVSYSELVEYFWKHIDPTDPKGQFCDKGSSYRSAIFYGDEDEKAIVEASLAKLKANKPFEDDIVTPLIAAKPFYSAEGYHQDYYKKNPIRYRVYRTGCGRDRRTAQLWGK